MSTATDATSLSHTPTPKHELKLSPSDPPLAWRQLSEHLSKWYYRPDLEALEIVLSAVAAHKSSQAEPVWLFVQGPSGSGKTAICIQSISTVPKAHIQGAMTPQTLLSFYGPKPGGLLIDTIGNNGILLFKDFTTILTMREESRSEIIGQLREVFDGKWCRATGNGTHTWSGKVTCIAACTPALERAWSTHRDMGERFLTVRWPRIGGKELALVAGKQQGFEAEIAAKTAALGASLVAGLSPALPQMSEEQIERVANLAEIVAKLRPSVMRAKGGGEVIDVPACEEPGRIHKSLSLLVKGHAHIWRRTEVTEDDMRLAVRVAQDTIPFRRLNILQHMFAGEEKSAGEIAKLCFTPQSTVRYNLEELEALGAVESIENAFDKNNSEWKLGERFLKLNREAGFKGVLR